jgi:hypothetical protein
MINITKVLWTHNLTPIKLKNSLSNLTIYLISKDKKSKIKS